MGPHRIIHNRRGYLTETYYDTVRGRFCERPFPMTAVMEPPKPPTATEESNPALPETDLHGQAHVLDGTKKTT